MTTDDVVEAYAVSVRNLERAQAQLREAELTHRKATETLTQWLLPKQRTNEPRAWGIWVNGRPFGFGDKRDVLVELTPRYRTVHAVVEGDEPGRKPEQQLDGYDITIRVDRANSADGCRNQAP